MNRKRLNEFQQNIGYQFKQEALLRQALTHSSYAHEKNLKELMDNERLEFLGDAVLEVVSSEFLFKNHPEMNEGQMTKLRASLVCEQSLATCARELELGKFLLLGNGEDLTGGRERDSILSDAWEALIGAMYLDGGFTSAKEFILKYVLTDIEHKKLFYDSKTMLQELIQNKYKQSLHYVLLSEEGPDHNKIFTVQAYMDDTPLLTGKGRTKKAAEQNAAYQSLLKFEQDNKVSE
ncbi:MAG: ribonuclease III [Lachnospiraceae bacterium]|nr:ribonuclease III [Lachnospiraceae bacterium]